MPERPLAARPPVPLTLAQQRIDLDTLLRERVRGLLAQADPVTGQPDGDVRDRISESAALLDATVRAFAEQVDRANDTRQRVTRGPGPVSYEQAVVIEGERGVEVVDLAEYTATPLYYEAAAGRIERVMRGVDVYGVLRDDPEADGAYERLGLA